MNASTARALLDQLRQLDESDRIEAKRASAIGKSVRETVCALANEPGLGGGWLLLGVEKASDAPGDYRVVGIEDPDKLLSDLHSQCANAFNVPVRIQARAEALEEGTVIVVEVSEADPASRPIHFASQRLAHLRDLGLVEQVPRGPATYYVPGERLEPLAEEGEGEHFTRLSTQSDGLYTQPEGLSTQPEGLSTQSEGLSREFLLSELPESLRQAIESMGQRSRDTSRMESVILQLCAFRPWSLTELATITGRNRHYLRHRYLKRLIRSGQLQRKYPDEPNRPDQAYIATEEPS